jgi:hypothetical protein
MHFKQAFISFGVSVDLVVRPVSPYLANANTFSVNGNTEYIWQVMEMRDPLKLSSEKFNRNEQCIVVKLLGEY